MENVIAREILPGDVVLSAAEVKEIQNEIALLKAQFEKWNFQHWSLLDSAVAFAMKGDG